MSDAVGEDRSSYQKVAPWRQDFGFCKATEGTSFQDPTFAGNWANLKAVGLPRGAYHFFRPAVSASAQAKYFMDFVSAHGLVPGDMLAIDSELTINAAAAVEALIPSAEAVTPRMHLSPLTLEAPSDGCSHDNLPAPVYGATQWCEQCRQYCGGTGPDGNQVSCAGCIGARAVAATSFSLETAVLAFLDEVKLLAGPAHPIVFYTYQAMAETFSAALAARYPDLWIAAYGTSSPRLGAWRGWRFWQVSSGGGLDGGDADKYNGTASDLGHWIGTYTGAKPVPPPSGPSPVPAWQDAIITRLPVLRNGARDSGGHVEWVRQAQLLLDITGPLSVVADGSFGPATEAAVRATQHAAGFAAVQVDGVIGPRTWQVLVASNTHSALPGRVAQGTTDSPGGIKWVHRIQALCDVHGVPATVDGVFGPATAAAVKSVQRAYGAAQTGAVDAYAWSLLIAHARP